MLGLLGAGLASPAPGQERAPAPYLAFGAGPTAQRAAEGRGLPDPITAMPSISANLDVVQRHSQLIVARARIVRTAVADPSIADVVQYSPNEISVIGQELGSTTLTLWFENSPEPLIYQVNTVRDPGIEERRRLDFGKLERKLAVLFPNSKIYLIPFSGKLVVKGQAHDAEEAASILDIIRGEVISLQAASNAGAPRGNGSAQAGTPDPATAIVNMLVVPGEFQVMLRVRIAELNRSQLRSMGVDLNKLLFDGRHHVRHAGGGSSTMAGIFENGEINAAVHALSSNGTAKILSEPVLTVMSGHTASFLSGGEFAVPTIVGVEGVGAQQTTFHGFGTSLLVTPTVLDRDLIRLNIVPEFSQLNSRNTVNGIPGIDTRRAQTTVQLREGQTIALAGLISHQSTAESSRLLGLSDVPYFGPRLFSGKRASLDETELLILVTPEIVRPMDADEVPPVPGHEVTHPNDCEFFRYGMTEGTPDQGVYQVAPYGASQPGAVQVGYHLLNSGPAPMGPGNVPGTGGTGYGPAPAAPPVPMRPVPAPPADQQSARQRPTNGQAVLQASATAALPDDSSRQQKPNATKGRFPWPFSSANRSQSTPQRPIDAPPANAPSTASPSRTDDPFADLPNR